MEAANRASKSRRGAAPLVGANSTRRSSGNRGMVQDESTLENHHASMDRRENHHSTPRPGSPWMPAQAPLPPGAWSSSGASNQGKSPQNPWGYPQGGFVNLLQQPYFHPPPQGENFHLVGLINQNMNGASPVPCSKGTPTPEGPSEKQARSRNKRTTIDIDDDDGLEASKSGKKRWTHDEEVILANAWLNNSNDPINGSDKKGETFWKQVAEEFYKKAGHARDINQLKIHWSRLKTSINDFNGFWSTVNKLHTSGYSEDQLMTEAQKMYASKHGKAFTLVHWWMTLKNEPKWCAYVERLEKEKNKSVTTDVADNRDQARPIGREQAKAQLKGKRKKEEIMDSIIILGDNINKMVQMQEERKVEREKVSKTQLEISRTNLKAAKEQKLSKLYEVYNSLINQDTSKMSEKEKASREKRLEKMELKLFADVDEPNED